MHHASWPCMEKGTYEDEEEKEEGREDCPRLQRWRGLRLPGAAATMRSGQVARPRREASPAVDSPARRRSASSA